MVDSNDTIYVDNSNGVFSGGIIVLGDGFNSEKEVEQHIQEKYERSPGTYKYGVLNPVGEETIDEPGEKEFTEVEEQRISDVLEQCEADHRVERAYRYRKKQSSVRCTIYEEQIRYIDGEIDFGLTIKNEIFDTKVPLPRTDITLKSLFTDLTPDNVEYLGYETGYASRGQRNPFVRVYGRIHRESVVDEEVRTLPEKEWINGVYWTDENIITCPAYVDEEYGTEVDHLAIIDRVSDSEEYDVIEDEIMDEVFELVKEVEENGNLAVPWIGKGPYMGEHNQVIAGIKQLAE